MKTQVTYHFKIQGMPTEAEYKGMPLGRKLEFAPKVQEFTNTAQSTWLSSKRKSYKKALSEFLTLHKPKEYYARTIEGSHYHDDSFQVWFK